MQAKSTFLQESPHLERHVKDKNKKLTNIQIQKEESKTTQMTFQRRATKKAWNKREKRKKGRRGRRRSETRTRGRAKLIPRGRTVNSHQMGKRKKRRPSFSSFRH